MSGTFKRLFRVAASVCFVLLIVLAPTWAAGTVTWDDGGGGGRRIAVWRTYHTYEGTTSVTNGTAASGRAGQPGTIFWGYIPPKGTFIHIR